MCVYIHIHTNLPQRAQVQRCGGGLYVRVFAYARVYAYVYIYTHPNLPQRAQASSAHLSAALQWRAVCLRICVCTCVCVCVYIYTHKFTSARSSSALQRRAVCVIAYARVYAYVYYIYIHNFTSARSIAALRRRASCSRNCSLLSRLMVSISCFAFCMCVRVFVGGYTTERRKKYVCLCARRRDLCVRREVMCVYIHIDVICVCILLYDVCTHRMD